MVCKKKYFLPCLLQNLLCQLLCLCSSTVEHSFVGSYMGSNPISDNTALIITGWCLIKVNNRVKFPLYFHLYFYIYFISLIICVCVCDIWLCTFEYLNKQASKLDVVLAAVIVEVLVRSTEICSVSFFFLCKDFICFLFWFLYIILLCLCLFLCLWLYNYI